MNMAMFYLTASMAMIPAGLAMFFWGIDKNANDWRYFGGIVVIFAVIMVWFLSNEDEGIR